MLILATQLKDLFKNLFLEAILAFYVFFALSFRYLLIYLLLIWQFLIVFSATSLAADHLVSIPDGSTATSVVKTASGIEQINIAAPNSSGLSHNRFHSYHVDVAGQVLNNFTGAKGKVVSTSIVGLVTANPNLIGKSSARVILNEITSNNVSQIKGSLEIAGPKSDVIIANPNGIVVNGGSFLNIDRLAMVVGKVRDGLVNPHLDNLDFTLSDADYFKSLPMTPKVKSYIDSGFLPEFTIIGKGINLQEVSQSQIIANLIRLNAPIKAGISDVIFKTGDDNFNYETGLVSSKLSSASDDSSSGSDDGSDSSSDDSSTSSGDSSSDSSSDDSSSGSSSDSSSDGEDSTSSKEVKLAIDATNLADIEAGNIFIIATKEGFGVKYSSDMIAQATTGIYIDAAGDVTYNNLESASNITVKSKGTINSGNSIDSSTVKASDKIDLTGKMIIHNAKSTIVANNLDLKSDKVIFNAGSLVMTNDEESDLDITFVKLSDFTSSDSTSSDSTSSDSSSSDFTSSDEVKSDFTNAGQIISFKDLNITTSDDFINKGIISSANNLTINSLFGDITNFAGAELITGSSSKLDSGEIILDSPGSLKLIAKKGTISQNSVNSVVVNGDHIIDAFSYVNNGRIDINGTLTMNIEHDLTNESGALIYANNDLNLNIGNDLINNEDAVIYAFNNIIIGKLDPDSPSYDATNNKINKLENNSGQIISYQGDIVIDVKDFVSQLATYPVQHVKGGLGRDYFAEHETKRGGKLKFYFTGEESETSLISAGRNIDINSVNFTNDSSVIQAGGNINIKAESFTNKSRIYEEFSNPLTNCWKYSRDRCYEISIARPARYIEVYDETGSKKTIANPDYTVKSLPASIKAAGSIEILSDDVDNTNILEHTIVENADSIAANFVNSLDIASLLDSGILNFNSSLTNYLTKLNSKTDGVGSSAALGLFKISSLDELGLTPLVETRSQFLDQSLFFGSDYFYDAIGVNLTDLNRKLESQNARLIGDNHFQNKLISDSLATAANDRLYLGKDQISANDQVKTLMDNAVIEIARLDLEEQLANGESLTQEQIDSLQKDIIWYEINQINGANYLVPKVYLTKATRNELKNANNANKDGSINANSSSIATKSTIFANNSISLTSSTGNLINSGDLIANNDLTITANKNIINKNFSNIISKNGDVNLIATNDNIVNLSNITIKTL